MTDTSWHYENFEPAGSAIGYRITRKLDEVQSPFQKIEIFETTDWGNLMLIDGAVMLTTRDNFLYHEMMSHPALFTHANPKRVVIIGGGDCGTLREVLKHPGVESATQCDIDEQVTRMAEKWFPELCDSNGDPRAELLFDDGIAYMANCPEGSVDIVIVDSTDPVGPAEGLFNKAFYASCFRALKDDGILVQQSESPLVLLELIQEMRAEMGKAGAYEMNPSLSATCSRTLARCSASSRSHLLSTITTAEPAASTRSASRWSCWVTPSDASIRNSAASARSIASSARTRL